MDNVHWNIKTPQAYCPECAHGRFKIETYGPPNIPEPHQYWTCLRCGSHWEVPLGEKMEGVPHVHR